jgi:tetratricopeptide (TPR) repeat protein
MKLKPGIFFLLWGICSVMMVYSQKTDKVFNADSVIRTINDPNEKVDFILKFLDEPENAYLENTEDLANRALEIAQQVHYGEGTIDAMLKLGKIYFNQSNYKKSMEYAQKSKELSEDINYRQGLAYSLRIIGIIYNELGDYDNSSPNFFKSLKLFEQLGNKKGISQSLGDIGMDFYSLQKYPKALDYYHKSLGIAAEIDDPSIIKRQYNNIAVVYGDLHKFDTAIVFLQKALEINIALGDKLWQGTNLMNIGFNQMNLGNYPDALINFQKAFDLASEMDNHSHMAECLLNFGFCYYSSGNVSKSIEFFKKALQESQQHGYYRIIYPTAHILNQIFIEQNDTLAAYPYVVLEKIAGDSLFAYQKQMLLSKLELQYIYEKKEFNKQLAQQAKNNLYLVIFISLILGMVILFLLFAHHRMKAKKIAIEKQSVEQELEFKNKELSLNLMALMKKNELMMDISSNLVDIEKGAKTTETKLALAKIGHKIRHSSDDKIWKEFSARFQEVHAGFYEALLHKYPDLTQNELKLCAFLRLNMSTKDISELTNQQLLTIDKARYRLRKKLGISNLDVNLVTFLSQIQ